jgi:hypothetical protein
MNEITHEDLAIDPDQAQEAFYAANEFKGIELKPFSEGRRAAAQALGVKILSGVQMPENGLYEGALWDCHIIIWLCMSEAKEIILSHRNPEKVMEKVMRWADENILPSDYSEELQIVGKILSETFKTKVIAERDSAMAPEPPGNE